MSVILGWLVAGRTLRPLRVMTSTGPHVPAAQVERLLQPFQRLSPDRAADADGSGLGLSIVAAIAKAHGAVLSARPGPQGGLNVEVTFASPATSRPSAMTEPGPGPAAPCGDFQLEIYLAGSGV